MGVLGFATVGAIGVFGVTTGTKEIINNG